MRIVVAIKSGSREQKIVKVDSGYYRIWVTSLPVRGQANEEMTEILAKYFGIRKAAIRIVIGKTAREKLVEIPG